MSSFDDFGGLGPEDVDPADYDPTQVQQISDYFHEDSHMVELHDSEIMDAIKIWLFLQTKYMYRPGTHANLASLAAEATDRFEAIGLRVSVDWIGPALQVPPGPPEIKIQGRTEPFDADRQRFDVRRGVADAYWKTKQN